MRIFRILKPALFTIFFVFLTMEIFPSKPAGDETIIIPSTYGWYKNGEINLSVHAWIFEIEENSVLRKNFIKLLKINIENTGSTGKEILNERVRYFLADNERGKIISISVSGEEYTLPGTSPDGHTLSVFKIKNNPDQNYDNTRGYITTLPGKTGNKTFTGSFRIISETGYSIISDIDDTIKESNVLNKKELVKNTFTREFKPVEGMPQLYRMFEAKGFAFHYVSGSPWQLYPAINNFLHEEQFPEGAVALKLFRVKDRSVISFILADQQSYKIKSIKTIIDRFPGRKFVLIGDSGEKDPEIYSELADYYKDKIKYIFIRDVGMIDENSSRRKNVIEKAGKVKTVIFKEAAEIEQFISDM